MTILNARRQRTFFTVPSNTDATIMNPRCVVEYAIEDAPVCDVAARVAEAVVDDLTVQAWTVTAWMSNSSCRHLLFYKRPHFLTQGS